MTVSMNFICVENTDETDLFYKPMDLMHRAQHYHGSASLGQCPHGSAIAWYHIGIPVIIAFRVTLYQEKNIRIL